MPLFAINVSDLFIDLLCCFTLGSCFSIFSLLCRVL